MAKFTPKPREKTVLDDPKLKLIAEKLPGADRPPTFHLYMAGNNPRIDVYTNLPNDRNNGLIRAAIDVRVMYTILVILQKLADTDDAGPYTIENKEHIWKDNQRSKDPVVSSRLVIGKDKEGRIYAALLAHDAERPKVRFYFGMPYYHALTRGNGEKLTDAEISVWAARAYVEAIKGLYPAVANIQYEHKTATPQGDNKQNSFQRNTAPAAKSNNNDDWGDDLPL